MSRAYSIVQALAPMNDVVLREKFYGVGTQTDDERIEQLNALRVSMDFGNAEIFYLDEDKAWDLDRKEGWWLAKSKQWKPTEGVTTYWFGPYEDVRDCMDKLAAVSK